MIRYSTVVLIGLVLAVGLVAAPGRSCQAQSTPEIVRTPPPPRDDLEADDNGDGVPDGWYNARDVAIETKGGAVGPPFPPVQLRKRRGRPARLSRAFGVDGRVTEAIVIGLLDSPEEHRVRRANGRNAQPFDRLPGRRAADLVAGDDGPLVARGRRPLDLGRQADRRPSRHPRRDHVGRAAGRGRSTRRRRPDLRPDPRGEKTETTNLVVNGDFELGDPAPAYWIVNHEAHRTFPGTTRSRRSSFPSRATGS